MLFNKMCSRAKLTIILIVIACLVFAISKKVKSKKVKVRHGPSGMSFDDNDNTNCSQFAKNARFNPYSVLRQKWFVFYYWAPHVSYKTFIFTYPSANHTKHLKRLLDGNVVLPVMWSARQILMEDNRRMISLLVERSDRGEYWYYPVAKVEGTYKITPRDVRLKQTGDNRIIGFMDCIDETLMVMSRLHDVPRKDKLQEEASRLGYRGRRGKSYLYQGHEWGPIPEADEEIYWGKKVKKDTSTEDKSLERSSEEVESKPINKEKKSKARESNVVPPVADLDQEMCVKVEPELWNDPKPSPNQNNNLITIEELNNFDDYILDTKNTLTIEAPDVSPSNKQENKSDMESEIMQENDKLDNDKDVQVHEMEMPLGYEPENLELDTESPDPEENNCPVCYKSQVSYISTDKPYRPESTHSITNSKNNEEKLGTGVPRTEEPRTEEPRTEERRTEEPRTEVPRTEEPRTEVPRYFYNSY